MRDAPDVVCVAAAYLSAYNARAFGVHDYIAQLMFNSPPGLSEAMDLAKMLAMLDIIAPLEGPDFRIWRQTRTGLLSYPLQPEAARAHLATSIYLQMALKPHIVHVVGHTEAHHAATAEDVIEACRMASRAIENALRGQPDMAADAAVKEAVPVAALPATHTPQVLEALAPAYPQYIDGVSVLHTGLNNMGAIFHPALTILNAGRIESTRGEYQFYIDGVTPSVARVLEVLDRERVTVAAALGIRAQTALEWLKMAYDATGADLHEAIHNQPGYYGIQAPPTLNHRYTTEDVPMSLVPIAALGQRYGVSVRGMDSIIRLACIIHQTDYWRRGRTLDKMGIKGLSVSELARYVNEGTRD